MVAGLNQKVLPFNLKLALDGSLELSVAAFDFGNMFLATMDPNSDASLTPFEKLQIGVFKLDKNMKLVTNQDGIKGGSRLWLKDARHDLITSVPSTIS